jgi:hypothetical protein
MQLTIHCLVLQMQLLYQIKKWPSWSRCMPNCLLAHRKKKGHPALVVPDIYLGVHHINESL